MEQYKKKQKQQAAIEAQKRSNQQTAVGAINTFAHYPMFGLHDEASGAIAGILAAAQGESFQDAYQKESEAVREAARVFGKDHPIMNIALQFGGGALTTAGLARAYNYLVSLGGITATTAQNTAARTAESLAASPAAQAAVEGGIAGLIGEPGAEDRGVGEQINDMAVGATFGAAAGKVADALPAAFGTKGYQARKALEQQFPRGIDQGAAELTDMNLLSGVPNPPMPYANVNPKAAQTAATVAEPEKRAVLEDVVTAQRRQQPEVVEESTRRITNTPQSRQAEADALLAAKRQEAKATYDPLKGGVIAPTEDMRRALATDQGQEAADLALKLMNNDRTMAGLPPMEMADAVQNFDFWHRVQKKLRRIGKQGENPLTGIDADLAKQANEIHGKVMDEIFTTQGQLGIDYQQATKRYAENMGVIDALADSAKFGSLDEGEVRKMVGGMSPDEREAFKVGVVNDLVRKVLRTGDEGDMSAKIIGNEQLRRNLRMVLGDDMYERLDKALVKLRQIPETNREVMRGSQTEPRRQRVAELMNDPDLADFQIQKPSTWLTGLGIGPARSVAPAVSDAMVDVSLATSPQQLREAAAKLEAIGYGKAWGKGRTPAMLGGGAGAVAGGWWAPDVVTPFFDAWELPSMGESYQFAKDVLTR